MRLVVWTVDGMAKIYRERIVIYMVKIMVSMGGLELI